MSWITSCHLIFIAAQLIQCSILQTLAPVSLMRMSPPISRSLILDMHALRREL